MRRASVELARLHQIGEGQPVTITA